MKKYCKMITCIAAALLLAASIPQLKMSVSAADTGFKTYEIIDDGEVYAEINSITDDEIWGLILKGHFENKSEHVSYMYTIDDACINGVSVSCYFTLDLEPGKKSNQDLTFYLTDSEKELIGEPTDICLSMRIRNNKDSYSEPIYDQSFHIYPKGQKNVRNIKRPANDDDYVIADTDDFSLILIDKDMDDDWGYTLDLYIVNKTDAKLSFTADDVSVNGHMIEPYWYKDVSPGLVGVSEMNFSEDHLTGSGIKSEDDIENIEFTLRVYENNSYGNDLYNENVNLSLKKVRK